MCVPACSFGSLNREPASSVDWQVCPTCTSLTHTPPLFISGLVPSTSPSFPLSTPQRQDFKPLMSSFLIIEIWFTYIIIWYRTVYPTSTPSTRTHTHAHAHPLSPRYTWQRSEQAKAAERRSQRSSAQRPSKNCEEEMVHGVWEWGELCTQATSQRTR